uniref:Uncharacterized protein n=2 Tax=Timema TaxID=61471 RepID=A0A7R9HQ51_9NEOP|nr:unnamed protein product [Timema monikensis]
MTGQLPAPQAAQLLGAKEEERDGLSDPFCTLYLSSANTHRYNTSVKSSTLCPVWEEHFSLPVVDPSEDVLHIEKLLDFDPAETVREKMMKFGDVKGVKGLRKLMKEIAVTASTGKHDNELVGSALMALRNIPASGMTYWCTLERKHKAKKQGDLKVRMTFSSEKNHQVASQEHRHLLRLLLLHELDKSKVRVCHPSVFALFATHHSSLPVQSCLPPITAVYQYSPVCHPSQQVYQYSPVCHPSQQFTSTVLSGMSCPGNRPHLHFTHIFTNMSESVDDCFNEEDDHDGEIFSKELVEALQWNGVYSSLGETILTQHCVQCGLNSADVAFAKWMEYVSVHVGHPLNFKVFADTLIQLIKPLQNGLLRPDEEKMFWEATKKLIPSCMNAIRKIRRLTPSERHTSNLISSILSVFSHLMTLQMPEGLDLFPVSVYGWLNTPEDQPNCDILVTVTAAVTVGAEDWFGHLLENNSPEDSTDESRLKHLIKIIKLAKIDLQKAVEFYEKLFLEALHISYATTLYTIYEKKISELTEEVVTEVCKTLKPLKFNDRPGDDIYDNDPLTMGTTLFELYLILQRFAVLGSGLSPEDCGRFQISQFHTWFHRGVAQWLDIALYKALQRIHKAVELDDLEPVDVSVKYSSSAVDTLAIYYQDICRCSVFYADKMSKKVEGMGDTQSIYEKKFEVTTEWCLAINNIEYVRQSIVPFVNELGMEEIVTSLGDYRSQNAADHCRKTLQLVIDNAVDTVGNKILELLETVAEKMTPSINRFLMEGAELLNQDCNTVDRLMNYLDDNLVTLHSQLNVDNFDRILAIIWEKLSLVMYALVESNLEKRRPPSFFANLSETLKVLVSFFRQGDESESREWNNEVLQKMEHLLLVHGLETSELIHQYFKERLMAQRDLETPSLGILTIRLQFVEDILRVEIMNARNIRPMDSNGPGMVSSCSLEGPGMVGSCSLEGPGLVGSCSPEGPGMVSSCSLEGPGMVSSCSLEGPGLVGSCSPEGPGMNERTSFVALCKGKCSSALTHKLLLNSKFIMLPRREGGRFMCSSCYQGGREVHVFIMLPSEDGGMFMCSSCYQARREGGSCVHHATKEGGRHLTLEQRQMKDAMVQFVIKDQDFLGMRNEFIGETFMSFSDIPKTEMTVGLEQMEQIHLKLSRPASLGTDITFGEFKGPVKKPKYYKAKQVPCVLRARSFCGVGFCTSASYFSLPVSGLQEIPDPVVVVGGHVVLVF